MPDPGGSEEVSCSSQKIYNWRRKRLFSRLSQKLKKRITRSKTRFLTGLTGFFVHTKHRYTSR